MGVKGELKLVADLHTHSIASVHAYATITELAQEASEQGLFALAVTDHAHLPDPQFFHSLVLIPEYFKGVRMLSGIEANVLDYDGKIDVDDSLSNKLDIVVASMHGGVIDGKPDFEKCTNAYLNLAKNPNVNIVGHSGSEYFKYDYDKVILEFAKNGKLVEINDSAFRYNKDSKHNCVTIAEKCMQYGARICVNTDAHFTNTLGRAYDALEVLEEIDFPQKLIVNTNIDNLKAYFDENNISY